MAQDLKVNRGTVFRAGTRLLQIRVLRCEAGQLAIQSEPASWDRSVLDVETVAQKQRWITRGQEIKKQRKPLPGSNETVATEQRFSVERKTGVKTIQKRRRGDGYVDNSRAAENDVVRELMNFYGALKGEALSPDKAKRLSHSAKTLLDVCSGDLQEAKALLRQSLAKPET